MAKIICTLEHASTEISGIKFEPTPDGMVSEEVTDDVAALFASIPGYSLVKLAPAPAPAPRASKKPAPAAEPAPVSAPAADGQEDTY